MRGEVKRFTKRYRSLKRSIEATVLQKLAPPLPFFLSVGFIRGKKRNEKKKIKKLEKKGRKEERKRKEGRGGEGEKKKETRRNETRNDSITWQDFKSSNAKRIFFTMSRGTWTRSVVPRYSKLCNAIATAQSDINFNGPERRHL